MIKKLKHVMLLFCTVAVLFASGCTEDGYVADKTYVEGVAIGAMSRQEAIDAIKGITLDSSELVGIEFAGGRLMISASDIGAVYNAEKTVDYALEKSKGVFSGWFEQKIPMQIDVDEKLFSEIVKKLETEVQQTTANITNEGIVIVNGTKGRVVNKQELLEEIKSSFREEKEDGIADIQVQYETVEPDKVNYEEFLNGLKGDFKEPEYIMDESGNITVTESSPGVSFDTPEAVKIMQMHTEEGETYTIKCEITLPENTKEGLEEALFRDKLGEYTTSYATSSNNRSANIALATSSINSMVLMPGEEFSFNDALGERTIANGYKTAGAYVAGKTVDQVGGGICQVSSTLYNTVLLSNLEIVERRSHQMTVSYVPLGRDATVNWGTTDFRFKNNTNYPVKLVGETKNKKVTISMVGTLTDPERNIKIETSTVSVIEPVEEIVEDAEKEVGFTETEKGSRGYVVDAVRVVYSGDKEISRETLGRSRYNAKKTITTIGTKPVEGATEAQDGYEMPPGLIPEGSISDTGL